MFFALGQLDKKRKLSDAAQSMETDSQETGIRKKDRAPGQRKTIITDRTGPGQK